jgi:hypothetical protein
MALDTSTWQLLEDGRFELRLRYPAVTPGGRTARIVSGDYDGAPRIQALSGERELYVEVVRFPRMAAGEEHTRHRAYLERRFGAGSVSELRETTLAARPAHEYEFRWPEGQRVAVIVSSERWTYRIIYNSASPLNLEVLATVELQF